jgi:hypothetical protein
MTAIYGPQMTSVLSGAFVYEWIQESNDYGIVNYPDITLQDNLNVSVGSPVPLQPDFNNLKSQWAMATPSGIPITDYTPSNTDMTCPATTAGIWTIDANQVLPDTPSKDTPTPSVSGIPFVFPMVIFSGSLSGSTNGSVASGASSSGTGSSIASKNVGGDKYGACIAFVAACIALGCMV